MVNKLGKCNSNKLLEITKYYELEVNEPGLVITATDGKDYSVESFSRKQSIEADRVSSRYVLRSVMHYSRNS